MKTRFLLHGGRLKLEDPRNDAYFQELTRNLVDKDEVLFVGFARRDEQDRIAVYEREKNFILSQTRAAINVVNATYDNLMQQIMSAKAIHITGGESPELVNDLHQYPDFIPSLKGKTIGGSSAGACLFSTYYFFNTEQGILPGLGTLPIRLLVHYGNPEFDATDASLELLKSYSAELELLAIQECAWVVRELNL